MKKLKRILIDDDKSATEAAFYYIICTFLTKAFAFISTPIFSRLMTKSEFGSFSNFTAWIGILTPILTLDLRNTINRSKYVYGTENDSYLKTILLTSAAVLFFFGAIFELNNTFFCNFFSMNIVYIRMMVLYMMFNCAFDYQQIQFQIYRKYKIYIFYTICTTIMSLALSIALVVCLEDKVIGRILGLVIPIIIVGSIININVMNRGGKPKFDYIKFAVGMSIPLIPSTLSATVLNASDKLIITKICGTEATALYSVSYSVAAIASILWGAINQAWAPWLMDSLNDKKFNDIKNASKKIITAYSGLIILLMLLAPEIVLIMGGHSYYDAILVMPPVILAMLVNFLCAFNYDVAYFYGQTYLISLGAILAAIINLVLNYLFVPKYGYIAAAYTTFIGYLFMYIYNTCLVKYKLKKSFVFDNHYFMVLIVILTVLQLGFSILYKYFVARVLCIGIYSLMLLFLMHKYRYLIINIVKNKLFKGHM